MRGSLFLYILLWVNVNSFSQISANQPISPERNIEEDGLKVGNQAPAFSKEGLSGELMNFPTSKLTLIDFWGTWCKPCIEELPFLQDIEDFYSNTELDILGLALDNKQKIAFFIKKHKIPWNQIILKHDDELLILYNVSSYPYPYIIDANGEILAKDYDARGYSLYQNIAKFLNKDPQSFLEHINKGNIKISVPKMDYTRVRINAGALAERNQYLYENDGYFARGFNWPVDADQVEITLEWVYSDGNQDYKKITIVRNEIKDGEILLTTE